MSAVFATDISGWTPVFLVVSTPGCPQKHLGHKNKFVYNIFWHIILYLLRFRWYPFVSDINKSYRRWVPSLIKDIGKEKYKQLTKIKKFGFKLLITIVIGEIYLFICNTYSNIVNIETLPVRGSIYLNLGHFNKYAYLLIGQRENL